MTTDELFNSCIVKDSTKVLADDCPEYIYDAYFYVKVMVDSFDARHVARLKRRICRFLERSPLVDYEDIDGGCMCSILDTTKLRNQRKLLYYIKGLSNIIAGALDAGAFLFIRLYEENLSDEKDDNGLTLKLANIVTKDVRLNVSQLVAVLKEMFSHQCVGFSIKFE